MKKYRSIIFSIIFTIASIYSLFIRIKSGCKISEIIIISCFILFCIFVIIYQIKDPRNSLYGIKEKKEHPVVEAIRHSKNSIKSITDRKSKDEENEMEETEE